MKVGTVSQRQWFNDMQNVNFLLVAGHRRRFYSDLSDVAPSRLPQEGVCRPYYFQRLSCDEHTFTVSDELVVDSVLIIWILIIIALAADRWCQRFPSKLSGMRRGSEITQCSLDYG